MAQRFRLATGLPPHLLALNEEGIPVVCPRVNGQQPAFLGLRGACVIRQKVSGHYTRKTKRKESANTRLFEEKVPGAGFPRAKSDRDVRLTDYISGT